MFSLIESKTDIARAQSKLEATLRRGSPKKAVRNIGYPGGTAYDANIVHDGHYWFWSNDHAQRGVKNPRRLNWFGLYTEAGGLQISVEINTPYEGRNDRVAGFFARDNDTGATYLMHSGRVGGGTKGVGQNKFLAWTDQQPIEVVDSDGSIRLGVLVMPVEGLGAKRAITRYVDSIVEFKIAAREGKVDTPELRRKERQLEDFYAEARGRRKGRRSSVIDYLSRHGDVVDAVQMWREGKSLPSGARFVKNILIDMGVAKGRTLLEVFEVKTSTSRSDVYSAIGQLLVHGTEVNCGRFIVLPASEKIADDLLTAFDRLQIKLLRFDIDESKASIID